MLIRQTQSSGVLPYRVAEPRAAESRDNLSNYAYLERYIPVVEFMGDICGKNYEIILHDVSTPERSVIAACNGHLSGRRVGDPMTELAKELIPGR